MRKMSSRGLVRLQLLQSVQNQGQRRPKEHFCIWGERVELVSDYQWSQIHKVQSHASLHPVLNDKKKQIKNINANALYDYERFFQERAPDGAGFAPVDSILGWFPVFGPTAHQTYVGEASTRGWRWGLLGCQFRFPGLRVSQKQGTGGEFPKWTEDMRGWSKGLQIDDRSNVIVHGAAACRLQQLTSVSYKTSKTIHQDMHMDCSGGTGYDFTIVVNKEIHINRCHSLCWYIKHSMAIKIPDSIK